MCWVEKSIYLWQRERERPFVSLQKQKNSKLGQGRRLEARKTSRWLILSAEEAAEHLQHAHDGASWLWKWSGSGLINRMTFRGGEMWGHVKAWKAKKILLHHEYIRTTRQCLRAEVDLSQSEEADSTKTRLTALRWRWSVRFYRTDWDYLRHTLQHKCPQKDRSTTSVQMHYMYISENICSSH